jgi:hypothetical protein
MFTSVYGFSCLPFFKYFAETRVLLAAGIVDCGLPSRIHWHPQPPFSWRAVIFLRFPLSDYVSTWLLIPGSNSFRTCCSSSTECTGFSLLAGSVAACHTWVFGVHEKRVCPKFSILFTFDSPQLTFLSKMKPLSFINKINSYSNFEL